MPTMQFYPAGDLFDVLAVPTGDWGTWHGRTHALPAELQPRAEMLAVAEFHDRGWKVIAGCPCSWEGELRSSRYQTIVERLATEDCPRCAGRGLDFVALLPPADIEGLQLELGDDQWDGVDDIPDETIDTDAGDDPPLDYGWPDDRCNK